MQCGGDGGVAAAPAEIELRADAQTAQMKYSHSGDIVLIGDSVVFASRVEQCCEYFLFYTRVAFGKVYRFRIIIVSNAENIPSGTAQCSAAAAAVTSRALRKQAKI